MRLAILHFGCCIILPTLLIASPFGDSTPEDLHWADDSRRNLQRYKTEPTYKAFKFKFLQRPSDESLLAPGYLFLTANIADKNKASTGAQIYDNRGNLVWHGPRHRAQDLKVSDFLGQEGSHLSVFNFDEKLSYFLDQSYSELPNLFHGNNGHEFRVLDKGETALRIDETTKQMDMKPYTGKRKGFVLDSCMVEVDIRTGKELFRWCPLDYIPVWQTTAYIGSHCFDEDNPLLKVNASMRSGKARCTTKKHAWDWSHGNAVDKADGDYIYCSRFLNQIIKVAGPDNRHGVKAGTIMWRLGGSQNDFQQDFNFSRQHHVRFISVENNETVISLFNNAWEGTNEPSSKMSEGQVIQINNETMKATLVRRYVHPEGELSEGRGSTQLLPNGNVIVGYGRMPDIVEYNKNGTALLHARFSEYPFKMTDKLAIRELDFSYRVFRFPWVGKPKHSPKLLAYSIYCTTSKNSPLIAYVSWNGATEVVTWRFYISSTTKNGPWAPVGKFKKKGFETVAHLSNKAEAKLLKFTPWVLVEGINARGEVLGSKVSRTFVPENRYEYKCNKFGCEFPYPFKYKRKHAATCEQGRLLPGYIALGMVVILVEMCYYLCRVVPISLLDRHFGYTPIVESTQPGAEFNDNDTKNEEVGNKQ